MVNLQGKNKTEEIIAYLDNETKRQSKFGKYNYRILSIYQLDGNDLGNEIKLNPEQRHLFSGTTNSLGKDNYVKIVIKSKK